MKNVNPDRIKTPKKIRITDIAKQANVSIGTVDRVIHNRGEVSDQTRKKILKIIEKVNYSPDVLASALATKRPHRIAVLIPRVQSDSSFWNAPLAGVRKAVSETVHFGIEVEYYLFDLFDPASFQSLSAKILKSVPDAILLAPVQYEQAVTFTRLCDEKGIPFVFINSNIEELNYLSYIGQDSIQSGYLAGRLMSIGFPPGTELLVVNISQLLAGHRHILKRNKGFEKFFADHPDARAKIHTVNIEDTGQEEVNMRLEESFATYLTINGLFVPSSRVFKVARYLNSNNIRTKLIGYDLTEENIPFLEDGTIDFLISQKPVDQGYYGIMALLNHLVFKRGYRKNFYLPIDIITKENLQYYVESLNQ